VTGFDLHTHTTFSDGTTTPEENVRDALACGLEGLGVTDHDTTDPFERARAAADGTSLELVLGTEFSAELEGHSVHVLGFWVERFRALGVEVSFERVAELAGGAPIGRPHIAEAVVETGAASEQREVFDTWLADGGPAYVEKHAVDPARAVELLVASGGVAVLAHPGLYGSRDGEGGIAEEVVERMVAVGLAGIEADHPDHTDEQRARYRDLARALRLEVTAWSDYHGAGKPNRLGCATTPRDVVERLRSWRRA
jgi:3',5'-nucleoside bisphosphate phosphatase